MANMRSAGSRESTNGENRQVNFSLAISDGLNSPSNADAASPRDGSTKIAKKGPHGKAGIAKVGGSSPGRNFRIQAKQSYENQTNRQANMVDTLDSFFD